MGHSSGDHLSEGHEVKRPQTCLKLSQAPINDYAAITLLATLHAIILAITLLAIILPDLPPTLNPILGSLPLPNPIIDGLPRPMRPTLRKSLT